jgi:hypothetical protein
VAWWIAKRIAKDVLDRICGKVHPVEIRYHPLFERWLVELAEADDEIFGEVMALLTALEEHGRDLDDEDREESHPVVTSRYDIHALRRTPPSEAAPHAVGPPVLRILYAICRTDAGGECAVVLLGGDKTTLGNQWYPVNLNEAQARLENYCRQHTDTSPIVKRGNR